MPADAEAGGAHNVLTGLTFGFAVWLGVGALIAQVFGSFVSGGQSSWELDKDDRNTSSGAGRYLTIFLLLRPYRKRMVAEYMERLRKYRRSHRQVAAGGW